MAPLNENESNLDSLYSNNDLNDKKWKKIMKHQFLNKRIYGLHRCLDISELPSNYEDNLSMSVNDPMANGRSEDFKEPILDKSLNNEEDTKEFMEKTLLSTNKEFRRRKKRVLT